MRWGSGGVALCRTAEVGAQIGAGPARGGLQGAARTLAARLDAASKARIANLRLDIARQQLLGCFR